MIQYLVLDWHDPSCNMARYDVLSIEPSLFGETTLTKDWSHISWSDQRWIALYENHTVDMEAPESWLQRKRRCGYVLRERHSVSAEPGKHLCSRRNFRSHKSDTHKRLRVGSEAAF